MPEVDSLKISHRPVFKYCTALSVHVHRYLIIPILCVWPTQRRFVALRISGYMWRRDMGTKTSYVDHCLLFITAPPATSDTAAKFTIGQGVLSAWGLTYNRAVSLNTVTTRQYSAPRQWYRVGQKTGPFFEVHNFLYNEIGRRSSNIKMFSSLSGVRMIFWMKPYLNILCIR